MHVDPLVLVALIGAIPPTVAAIYAVVVLLGNRKIIEETNEQVRPENGERLGKQVDSIDRRLTEHLLEISLLQPLMARAKAEWGMDGMKEEEE